MTETFDLTASLSRRSASRLPIQARNSISKLWTRHDELKRDGERAAASLAYLHCKATELAHITLFQERSL